MAGYNSTIFTYGQTSSGKTHTLIGIPEDPGITPLAIHDTFHLMKKESDRQENQETKISIRISYFETYNDRIFDLLTTNSSSLSSSSKSSDYPSSPNPSRTTMSATSSSTPIISNRNPGILLPGLGTMKYSYII